MYELLGFHSGAMLAYWGSYGLLTGVILMIAIYLLISPRAAFSPANVKTSPAIRRWGGIIIGLSGVEYILVFSLVYWMESLMGNPLDGAMSAWGNSCAQQMFVLLFLPVLSLFLHAVLQGMTKVRPIYIIWLSVFPAFLLIWTIVYGFNHSVEELAVCTDILTIARVYWGLYIALLVYYYSKALRQYRKQIMEMYSDVGYRELEWLYVLGAMNVLYMAWFICVYGYNVHFGWGVFVQHIFALIISVYTCYHADRQERIVWDKEEKERVVLDENSPVVQDLNVKIDTLLKQQFYLNPDLTRDELVDQLKTNRTYLNLYFACKGLTFYSFVNNYRIEYAVSLMEQPSNQRTLSEIAFMSGFKSLEVFSRQFKVIKGCLPSQYNINSTITKNKQNKQTKLN